MSVTVIRPLADPGDARRLFVADPAMWLPWPITEHGAHEFRSRVRVLGAEVPVEFHVGDVWTNGAATSRSLQIAVADGTAGHHTLWATLVDAATKRSGVRVDGCLTVEPTPAAGAVRFDGRVVGGRGASSAHGLRLLLGRLLARRIHREIAAALAPAGRPDVPSR